MVPQSAERCILYLTFIGGKPGEPAPKPFPRTADALAIGRRTVFAPRRLGSRSIGRVPLYLSIAGRREGGEAHTVSLVGTTSICATVTERGWSSA